MNRSVLSPAVNVSDFDPNIHVDNTKEGGGGGNSSGSSGSSPLKQVRTPTADGQGMAEQIIQQQQQQSSSAMHLRVAGAFADMTDEELSRCPARLAARTLLSHLINHLFHFPLPGAAGAASLTSMVSEHDDLDLANASDDLSSEIFSAPNVQFFLINNSTLLSFVELPSLNDSGKFFRQRCNITA